MTLISRFGLLFLWTFGSIAAAPIDENKLNTVTLLRSNQDLKEDGTFNWSYDLSDGSKAEQSGYLKNVGTDEEGISIQGSYSYIEPEGKTIALKYIADEGGFQPEGDHLPTAPPIPEAIQKALAILYKNAAEQLKSGKST